MSHQSLVSNKIIMMAYQEDNKSKKKKMYFLIKIQPFNK